MKPSRNRPRSSAIGTAEHDHVRTFVGCHMSTGATNPVVDARNMITPLILVDPVEVAVISNDRPARLKLLTLPPNLDQPALLRQGEQTTRTRSESMTYITHRSDHADLVLHSGHSPDRLRL